MNTYPSLDRRIEISNNFRLEHSRTSASPNSFYHYHDSCEVYLFLRGSVTLYDETRACCLKRGDLFLFRPDELHRVRPDPEIRSVYERCTVHIRESFLRTLSSEQTDLRQCFRDDMQDRRNYLHLTEREIESFLEHFERIRHFYSDTAYGNDLRLFSALTEFFIRLNQLFQSRTDTCHSSMPRLICDIMQYLDERLTAKVQLQDLSSCLSHNGAYLSRRFKEETGITIRQYLIYKRVILAKKLLREGCPLSRACTQSGFQDYSNFSRTFTRQVGCSPGYFQKHGETV